MTTAIIFDTNKDGTPFDVWAGLLLSIGVLLYVGGAFYRNHWHELRNRQQIRAATRHFAGKRKS